MSDDEADEMRIQVKRASKKKSGYEVEKRKGASRHTIVLKRRFEITVERVPFFSTDPIR